MNLANTIRLMAEKKGTPPWDGETPDYAGAAKKIRDYAKKSGGIDKSDMLSIANQLDALAKKSSPKLLARTMTNIGSLDTDVRDKIKQLMKESNCMEALELDEAMVRGKEVFDKTFANRKQADDFAQKNGGRVKQVGRVFYVFKEAVEDDEPASPDEGSMAMQQLEFIEYAAEEIGEHIKAGGKFPEWMQNKLATVNDQMQSLHAQIDHEEIEDDEPEEMDEAKRDPSKSGGTGYDLYHKDFSSAMKHAYDYAKSKLGVEIDPKEIDDKVASGPRKPSAGKTNSYRLKGKDGKKGVQIQVANLDNKKYELNMYKESVEMELDENAGLIKDYQGMKAQGKKDHNILDALMSMPKYKRMSKDQMAKIIGDAKRKGIFKEEVELDEAYKTPSEASAYEAGKKAAREGKKYQDNPNKKGTAEFTAWSKGHNEARAKGMKEESELDETFMKWQVKVGAKVWRGTARNAGEAVKKARPSMGNLDLTKASVTRIKEDIDMTLEEAREDTATQVARALKKMGVKPNAKEADIIKKIPGVLKKMGLENDKLIKRDPDFIGDVLNSMNEDIDIQEEQKISLEEAVMLAVFGEAKKDKKAPETDKDDDGEGMDPVDKKALKKDYDDRAKDGDGDLDNDGDEDKTDKYLHKKRQAVTKAINNTKKGPKSNGKSEPVDTTPTMDEEMSDDQMKKRDEIMKGLEKKKGEFVSKYGDRAKEVMARTATKMAMKESSDAYGKSQQAIADRKKRDAISSSDKDKLGKLAALMAKQKNNK